MWGSLGSSDGQFCHMEHLALDKYDNVYVNDPQSGPNGNGIPRVQKFDSSGHFITKWGSYGSGNGQFVDPEHLAVDSHGFVYVTDRHNNNIQVFAPVNMTITGNRITNNITLPEQLPPKLVNGTVTAKI